MVPAPEAIGPTGGEMHVVVPHALCGPPDCANGGIVAGLLARQLHGTVEVTLRRPVPLDEPLTLERLGSAALLRRGPEVLALAQPGDVPPDPPFAPTWAQALEASCLRPPPESHPFPTCFVCGPGRDGPDALGLRPGPLSRGDGVAAPWIPDAAAADGQGLVRPELLWAALDCPGGFAALAGQRPRPILLGRMTARIGPPPPTGAALIVHGWRMATDGRRTIVGTALHELGGRVVGVARSVWFAT